MEKTMIVMKFGGSSIANGSRIRRVAKIIKESHKHENVVIVVSALAGVTDKLISIFHFYQKYQFEKAFSEINFLFKLHIQTVMELKLSKNRHVCLERELMNCFGQLSLYLSLNRELTKQDYDHVISFGERFASLLLAGLLNELGIKAKAIDSAKILVTSDQFGSAKSYLPETTKESQKVICPLLLRGITPVVTGFYGSTKDGQIAILGRGGSDYSATILAHALDASEVILWKEVDGVFTGDPKKDNNATFLPELSYKQALSLAKKGAKILHPEAMEPVASKGIVVRVKNTFNPKFSGTKIWKGDV